MNNEHQAKQPSKASIDDDNDDDIDEDNDDDDGRVVAAVKSFMRSMDAGPVPDIEAFLQQHAEIADQLRPSLEGLALVHRAAAGPVADAGPFPVQESAHEFTTQPIGDFQILGELGRGGMGVVYEAKQLSLGRHVALKVLPFASGLDEVRLQRFRNEAHAAAALHHTHIVPVYAVGSDRGVHYYAMQLIDGNTLADFIANLRRPANDETDAALAPDAETHDADSPIPSAGPSLPPTIRQPSQPTPVEANKSTRPSASASRLGDSRSERAHHFRTVVKMIHQAALAIDHAHQYGVVHRDIKPANLLLDSAGKIWVADFGLAQIQSDQTNLTRTGDPMGTLRYMSPEQATGRREAIDHRTDVYSLGVTLYELLTLQSAIHDGEYRDMLNRVALVDPPPPKSIDPSLPIELDTIVRKAIAKSPADRYATAAALADDLQAWMDDKPITARPPTWIERVNKWRRRNNGLVAAASLLLLVATAALATTTVVIWTQQRQTSAALDRETRQRHVAEKRFNQARKAVETFSQLSETELSHREGLQDLRRSFLETSLAFYKEFLEDPVDDSAVASGLQATKDRVQGMIQELRVLDDLQSLMLLSDERVQAEVHVSPTAASALQDAISNFMEQRSALANQFVGGLNEENDEMSVLLHEFQQATNERLSAQQLQRLHQLNRQRRLPFTFKRSEVVNALGLSRPQIEQIDRIIVANAPAHIRGPRENGPPRNEPHEGPREGPRRAGGHGPPGPPHLGPGFGKPPPGEFGVHEPGTTMHIQPPMDDAHRMATKITVKKIQDILTDKQRQQWAELIGTPFQW